ncbi:MAG: S41 family peptidase [Gemmatimonadaceae bacterium]
MRRTLAFRVASFVFALYLSLGSVGCSRATARSAAAGPSLSRGLDSALATATFDSAWSRIHVAYYDSTFHGTDWAKLRAELRPRAAAAREMSQVRATIEVMFERLGDSHFALIPSEAVRRWENGAAHDDAPGELGLEFRFADGVALVSRILPHSAAAAASISMGWRIERLGGTDVDSLVRARRAEATPSEQKILPMDLPLSLMGRTLGPAGSSVRLVLRDATGRRIERTLVRQPVTGFEVRMGHLPPQNARVESERRLDADGCVGVLRFNVWMLPVMPRIDAAMDDLRRCRAIVIDLRGNPGGVAAMVMGVGGHFVDTAVSLGTMSSRGLTMRYLANPRRVGGHGESVQPFHGALAILVDGVTVSTSEIFAGGMQQIGRARIFGETTPGEALPSAVMKLPNGDVMQYVVGDFALADGRRLERRGVIPDVVVPLRRADLLAGRDATLDAALRWIAGTATRTALAPR